MGPWQKTILAALKNNGPYVVGSGWKCGNKKPSYIVRVLEKLVLKGFAVKTQTSHETVYRLPFEIPPADGIGAQDKSQWLK